MHLIKTILVLIATVKAIYAYDNADVRFEVEKIGHKRLIIKAFERSTPLFSQTVDQSFNSTLVFGQNIFSRHGSSYKIVYRGSDATSLSLEVDDEGNISLAASGERTGFERYKSWGFKTSGIIRHTGASLFYKMFTHAKQLHNYGILKSYTGEFLQSYIFNGGVIHFGDDTAHVIPEAYLEYLAMVDGTAEPTYENGIIDDQGVILADKGLRITNLTYRSQGLADIGGQGLELQNAGIDNRAGMNVEGPIRGTMHHFKNHGAFFADSMDRSSLTISNWTNSANVYLRRESDIFSQDTWDNTGQIFVRGNSSVGCRKKPQALGVVIADGVIKSIIEEAMDEASSKALLGGARFFSGKRKIILDILKHTDHYLNTITNHYTVSKSGVQYFSHKTETGYIFQSRTTEKTPTEVEIDGSETPEGVKIMTQSLQERGDFLKALKNGIKDRLKKLGLLHASQNGIMAALMKGLSEAGLSSDDIDEIFAGEGAATNLLDIVSAYEQLPAEGIQKLQSDVPAVHSFLSGVASQAQRAGIPIWQWAQRNGPEFVEGFCNLAILASRFTPHPAVTVPARVCTLGQLALRPTQNLQKAQAFFNKKHGDGGKSQSGGGSSGHMGAHQPVVAPVSLPAFPEAVIAPRKTYVQGGGAMRRRWKDKDYIYEWDSRHGTVEKYNKRGTKHLGEFDPITGKELKSSNPAKTVEP